MAGVGMVQSGPSIPNPFGPILAVVVDGWTRPHLNKGLYGHDTSARLGIST
jgi:hypothetical protein